MTSMSNMQAPSLREQMYRRRREIERRIAGKAVRQTGGSPEPIREGPEEEQRARPTAPLLALQEEVRRNVGSGYGGTNGVIRLVCAYLDVMPSAVRGPNRAKRLAAARHIAAWALVRFHGRSTPEIGISLGNRDHSTIIAAVQRVEAVITALELRCGEDIVAWIEALALAYPWPQVYTKKNPIGGKSRK